MKSYSFYLILLVFLSPILVSAQDYDVMKDIIERNPEYKIDEYYEIERDKKGNANMVLVVKSILNGSEKITKTYYKGTPFYKDQEWLRGTVKMPNQTFPIDGYVSFNQVFQHVKFKLALNDPSIQQIVPEYFMLDTLTLWSFPNDDLLANGFYTSIPFRGFVLMRKHGKYQKNNPNQNLQGYVIDKPKYEAEFTDAPEFFLKKDDEILKVEKNNYFFEAFNVDKKIAKIFLRKNKSDLKNEVDVIRFLDFLLK